MGLITRFFSPIVSSMAVFIAVMVGAFMLAAPSSRAQGDEAGGSDPVSVAGLRVVAAPYQDEQSLRAFNWFAGTAVAMQVQHPGGNLIDIDREASQLSVFADDQGTDLTRGKDRFGRSGIQDANMSKDGKVALVEVNGPGVPGQGATRLHLKGTLVFTSASGTKTVTAKDVSLKAGTKAEADPVSVSVKKVGKPQWGDMPMEVTLTNEAGLDQVAEVKFLDRDGKTIKSQASGSFSSNGKIISKTYRLAKKLDTATIQFDVWQGLKPVKIPFDVTTAVGLQTQ